MEDKKFVALTKEQIKNIDSEYFTLFNYSCYSFDLMQMFLKENGIERYAYSISGYSDFSQKRENVELFFKDDEQIYNCDVYVSQTSFLLRKYNCINTSSLLNDIDIDLSAQWRQTLYNAYGENYINVMNQQLGFKELQLKKELKQVKKDIDTINLLSTQPNNE